MEHDYQRKHQWRVACFFGDETVDGLTRASNRFTLYNCTIPNKIIIIIIMIIKVVYELCLFAPTSKGFKIRK